MTLLPVELQTFRSAHLERLEEIYQMVTTRLSAQMCRTTSAGTLQEDPGLLSPRLGAPKARQVILPNRTRGYFQIGWRVKKMFAAHLKHFKLFAWIVLLDVEWRS